MIENLNHIVGHAIFNFYADLEKMDVLLVSLGLGASYGH